MISSQTLNLFHCWWHFVSQLDIDLKLVQNIARKCILAQPVKGYFGFWFSQRFPVCSLEFLESSKCFLRRHKYEVFQMNLWFFYEVNKCEDLLSTHIILIWLTFRVAQRRDLLFNSISFYIDNFLSCIIHVFFFYIFEIWRSKLSEAYKATFFIIERTSVLKANCFTDCNDLWLLYSQKLDLDTGSSISYIPNMNVSVQIKFIKIFSWFFFFFCC